MRNFRRTESFDLIINMFSSFGYFENPGDDLKVLENVYRTGALKQRKTRVARGFKARVTLKLSRTKKRLVDLIARSLTETNICSRSIVFLKNLLS
ncbi:hypothetical protein MJD09_25190 [bacterium]|nr:hypothetical protein [bacterium]